MQLTRRGVLVTIGVCVAIALCLGGWAIWRSLSSAKNDALAFARMYLTELSDSWQMDALYQHTSDVFRSHRTPDEVRPALDDFAQSLGKFVTLEPAGVEVSSRALAGERGSTKETLARLKLYVQFEKSRNRVYMELSRAGGRWLVDELRIDPEPVGKPN